MMTDPIADMLTRITLKYLEGYEEVFTGLKRISKPGRRVYVGKDDIPRVMGGYGFAILSTSRGILTDEVCRREGIGGELLCNVW
jgi:small subunit ribosomal protein S8